MKEKHEMSLAGIFIFLTKQYIGKMSEKMKGTSIEKYYYPLYIIWKHNGEINQQTLAEYLFIDKVSLVRILDALCEDNLIIRQKSNVDKRKHLLVLTEKAIPLMPKVEKALRETNNFFLNLVSSNTKEAFSNGLKEMVAKAKEISNNDFEFIIRKV